MNPEPADVTNGYWMPTIVVNEGVEFEREKLLATFEQEGIDGRVFFWPLSSLPMFTPKPENIISHSIYKRAINLPSYHDLSTSQIERVCALVRSTLK